MVLSAHGTHAVLVVVRENVCCVRMRVRVGLFGFVPNTGAAEVSSEGRVNCLYSSGCLMVGSHLVLALTSWQPRRCAQQGFVCLHGRLAGVYSVSVIMLYGWFSTTRHRIRYYRQGTKLTKSTILALVLE